MAYTYSPYEYQSTVGARPTYVDDDGGYWETPSRGYTTETGTTWDKKSMEDQRSQFQDYTGEQFKGLFDMATANKQQNPLSGFSNAPMYSPLNRSNYESDNAFQDARFGNINSYLGNLGTFLGNMGGDDPSVANAAVQRAIQQANMPQVGAMQNYSGTPSSGMPTVGVPAAGSSGGLGGFANYRGWGSGQVPGGWGSHPVAGGLLGFGGE